MSQVLRQPARGPALLAARSELWRVAVVAPLSGPGGFYGPACQTVAELAAHELNADGGVLGRQVEIEIVDAGGAPAAIAAEIHDLVEAGMIDAVVGPHLTEVRHAVSAVVSGRIPYVFTSIYEGGPSLPGVYCLGATPDRQIRPALRWMRDNGGIRSWYFIGSNLGWPRRTLPAVRLYVSELGLDLVGSTMVEYGEVTEEAVAAVAASGADAAFVMLLGQDAVKFNRYFGNIGLHTSMLRFGPLLDETVLLASGIPNTRGLLSAGAYFRTSAGAGSADFRRRYAELHGSFAPLPTRCAVSVYEGMQLLSSLIAKHGSLTDLPPTADGIGYESPRGTVEFVGNRARQPLSMATADGVDFAVVDTI